MTAVRVRDALLLAGDDLDALAAAVALAQRARHAQGLAPSPRWVRLAAVLADRGHADNPTDDTEDAGPMQDHRLTVDAAAVALGVSARTARRLAPELGGHKIGGTWLLDAEAVAEHREGTTR